VNDVFFNVFFNVMLTIRLYDSIFLSKLIIECDVLHFALKRKPENTAEFVILVPELGQVGFVIGILRNRKAGKLPRRQQQQQGQGQESRGTDR